MSPIRTSVAAAVAVLALSALGGCSTISDMFDGGKTDYRTGGSTRTAGLEVPPDLTKLSGDSRYQPQRGVISASSVGAVAAPGAGVAAGAVAAVPAVAALEDGAIRVQRNGQERWLVVPQPAEQLWPRLQTFWEQRGFILTENDPQIGVMQTEWAENRTKLPDDIIRNTIGRVFGSLYDTGERDRFRTRVERTATGSEIYIAHRGLQEIYTDARKDNTTWVARPSDPQLEAEMLSRLMVALGSSENTARSAVADTKSTASPQARTGTSTASASPAALTATSLVVDEPFDRAWRRVGLALDRSGFTVEDRDRAGGLYYVRYVDPKSVGQEGPGWWAKLWGGGKDPQAAVRYRVALKGDGAKTAVTVQNSAGAPETGDNAKRIVALLVDELR